MYNRFTLQVDSRIFQVIACLCLFLAIGIGLLSLSAPTIIMTNAKAPSNTTSGSSNSTSNETRATQMGICVEGLSSPCNHDSNSSDMPR